MLKQIELEKSIQNGFLSIRNITSSLNKNLAGNIKKDELKSDVILYIKKHKETHLSELITEFNVSSDVMITILNELKEKKIIRKVD